MKKKTRLIPLTINRAKWARGGYNGESRLLNDDGNMCCLGFACRARGFRAENIKDIGTPSSLEGGGSRVTRMEKLGPMVTSEFNNSDETDHAVSINDNQRISDKMREYRLKPILKKLGFAAKFVGPTRPISDK
jgi:hypothetical protein